MAAHMPAGDSAHSEGSGAARPARPLFAITISRDTVSDLAIIVFFLWASTGLRPFLPGFLANERYIWLLADLVVVAWFALRPGEVLRMVRKNVILTGWGFLACLSLIWSWSGTESFYFGLQLVFTILAGFLLCTMKSRARLVQLLFLALLPTQLISFFVNYVAPNLAPGFPGGGAFSHKNVLGNMMLLQLITSMCLFLQGWRPALTGLGFLAAAFLIATSDSTSALLISIALVGGVAPIALLYRGNINLTRAALGVGTLVCVCAVLAILITGFDPVSAVLGGVGKDITLTGRTVLWEFGWNAFLEFPWHGHGYKGYWISEQTTVLLLRYVMQQDLIHFHNDFVETAVAFGVWGPLLLILGLVAAFRRALLEFLVARSLMALWAAMFVIFIVIYATAEHLLFVNHGLLQVVFVIASAARDRPKRHC
jgi:O-antigen ligase